jgi:tRNA modification GTPase
VAAPLAAMFPDRGTIFALASAPGAAGIAVWRVSGIDAAKAYKALCGGDLPEPRMMTRVRVKDARGDIIDDGFAAWFPNPASFTGDDMLELYLHGGRAVTQAVATALGSVSGLRLAEPGEFTRRAVEAGKLDLTRAEAIADLVAAETEAQRRQARRQMGGALGVLYNQWSTEILGILARFEAGMDFPDEDLPTSIFAAMRPRMESLHRAMNAHLNDDHRGERIRDGIRVAIVGAPNVGKSSLMNALAKRDVAIVSAHPGTTRDVVEVALDLGGVPVVVADTAGLRETDNEIEAEGIKRAKAWAGGAEIIVAVVDAQEHFASAAEADFSASRQPYEMSTYFTEIGHGRSDRLTTVLAVNKVDLAPGVRLKKPPLEGDYGPIVFVSARTGEGIDELIRVLRAKASDLAGFSESAPITRARHRVGVQKAADCLARALAQDEVELAGEDLRHTVRALGEITGAVGVDDLLDVIFREFCIGK